MPINWTTFKPDGLGWASGYKCNKPGDQSGDYLPRKDVEILVRELQEYLDWMACETGLGYDLEEAQEVAKFFGERTEKTLRRLGLDNPYSIPDE
jgi:hypothetical protein